MIENIQEELVSAVWLTLAFGPANPYISGLTEKYGSAADAFRAVYDFSGAEFSALLPNVKEKVRQTPLSEAEKLIEDCQNRDIQLICRSMDEYPDMLRNIANPPELLYVKGDISDINTAPSISIVGTRKPTDYSIKVCTAITSALVECGFNIISGFAEGIDIVSHTAAIAKGGRTYAVLGCGIAYDYPKNNNIYRASVIKNGAFISEYPPLTTPQKFMFPTRNRILSGLSAGTCIIEANVKSGSLITANHANDQGKSVFVVPPNDLFNPVFGGNVSLIRDGAIPLFSAKDVINDLYNEYSDRLKDKARELLENSAFIDTQVYRMKSRNAVMDSKKNKMMLPTNKTKPKAKPKSVEKAAPKKEERLFENLPDDQKKCAQAISNAGKPITIDEISYTTGFAVDDILSIITDMEMDGIISSGAGGTYSLN